MSFAKEVWTTLASVDCSQHIEKKGNLSYLSWAWAWATLMDHYPESEYSFEAPVTLPDGTVEVWCAVVIRQGEKALSRRMFLSVMDHRNAAIVNPSSRQIGDTRMRCMVKCLAMFGLGHYIYAGQDLPDPSVAAAKEAADYEALTGQNADSIEAIKAGIESGDLSAAAEAWFELDKATMEALWKAPSKGGVFTTKERDIMKSKEFRTAYYGDNAA